MSITLLKNGCIFDGVNADLIENATVVIENERIKEVSERELTLTQDNVETIDLGGRFLMPGLIDLHFHAYSASFNMDKLDHMPKPLLVSYAVKALEGALARGFTSVRDPGGGDVGLSMAVDAGLVKGPRFFYGGKALSQTGGHGDMRPATREDLCHCAYSGVICQVVDGVDQVRKVVREELRKGADHIKIFISGGVTSPTDPMWMPQFTDDEIRTAVQEATTRRKYVVAHCHTDDGAKRCVENGVRSIDHGTSISRATAELIAASDTSYVVPTLGVMHQLTDYGDKLGLYPESLEKARGIVEQACQSIENCMKAGVKVGLGTDIFGAEFHYLQSSEFEYRSAVSKPVDILRSATSINAEILQREGDLGCIAPGALADLIVLEKNPLNDLSQFKKPEENIPVIMKSGCFMRMDI